MSPYVVELTDPSASDPSKFGPKAANQAALGQSGLPFPGGFCLSADAYFAQIKLLELEDPARQAGELGFRESRPFVSEVRIAMFDEPIADEILEPLLSAYRTLTGTPDENGRVMPVAVRSSALMEDTEGSSFAGQFQTFLGIDNETDFLTAVRACWGALWSSRALQYMQAAGIKPAETGMAVLVQPLVQAIASGGGLSKSASGGMSVTATWGLGEAIAQGEVVPDRYDVNSDGDLIDTMAGRKVHNIQCSVHGAGPEAEAVSDEMISEPCLTTDQVLELVGYMKTAEELAGQAVEIEWAMDEIGIKMLQARPLALEPAPVPDAIWLKHPGLRGQPGGIGWGAGRACVINCECEIGRVNYGDVLVTKVAGPALANVLAKVSGVVAELGGSTSHLASLARERGVPVVLGVLDATTQIPDGSQVGVDGVAGIVRWMDTPGSAPSQKPYM
jgi:pyruvate,water dikinase